MRTLGGRKLAFTANALGLFKREFMGFYALSVNINYSHTQVYQIELKPYFSKCYKSIIILLLWGCCRIIENSIKIRINQFSDFALDNISFCNFPKEVEYDTFQKKKKKGLSSSKEMIVLCKLQAWILNQRCEVSQMNKHCSGSAMECGLISF